MPASWEETTYPIFWVYEWIRGAHFDAMLSLHPANHAYILNSIGVAVLLLASSAGLRAAQDDIHETASPGTDVTLTVTSDGSPTPAVQWLKEGVEIPGATQSALVLRGVTTADAGVYNAVATNAQGWAISNDLILLVKTVINPPVITVQPFGKKSAGLGGTVSFTVAATSTPSPTFQWKKNGIEIAGATQAELTLSLLKLIDAGTYSVTVTNTGGSVTSSGVFLSIIDEILPGALIDPKVTNPPTTEPTTTNPTTPDPMTKNPAITDATITDPTITDPTIKDPTVKDPTIKDPTIRDPLSRMPRSLLTRARRVTRLYLGRDLEESPARKYRPESRLG